MKLGLGLYRHMLTAENYDFARQCGCTHVVAHLVDYFNQGKDNERENQPTGGQGGWGRAGDPERLWTYEELAALKAQVNNAGLGLAAIENLDPAHWYDVLLDGPRKKQQLENLQALVRNMGQAGIPVLGYNFSLAGVAGRSRGPYARGAAISVGMDGVDQTPIPKGMVWNMVYDPQGAAGVAPTATSEALWQRLKDFLDAIVPVAEEAGVTLAAHPDDPPVPV
ncbi:MAG: mannonate dehydratase, partial [Terriglobia bacterium]